MQQKTGTTTSLGISRLKMCLGVGSDAAISVVHRFAFGVIIIAAIAVACSQAPPEESPVRLLEICSGHDRTQLSHLIDSQHALVRRQLDSLLVTFITARTEPDSVGSDSLSAALSWLCEVYRQTSDQEDKQRRLTLYQQWTSTQVQLKGTLDSTFRIVLADFKAPQSSAERLHDSEFVDILQHLRTEYHALGDSFHMASVIYQIADFYWRDGTIDSAMEHLRLCRSVCTQTGQTELGSDCYLLLGKLYRVHQADYLNSERSLQAAVEGYRAVGRTDGVAYGWMHRANNFVHLFQSQRAITGFRLARDEFARLGLEHPQSYCTYSLAESYYDLGELDSAWCYADSSLHERRSLAARYPRYLHNVGYTLSLQGLILHAGADYEEAGESYALAGEVFQSAGDDDGVSLNNIRWAALHLEQGDYSQARERYEWVLQNSAEFEANLIALLGLAVCDRNEGNNDGAVDKMHRYIDRLEISRSSLPIPEIKSGMLSDKIGGYHLLADIFIERHQQTSDPVWLDSAFYYLERSKSRTLLEMLGEKSTTLHCEEIEQLVDRISNCDNSLLLGQGDSAWLAIELVALEDSLHRLRLADAEPSPSGRGVGAPRVLKLEQISEWLNDEDLLLEYMISDIGLYVFVITRESISIQALEINKERLEDEVAGFLRLLTRRPAPGHPSDRWKQIGKALWSGLAPNDSLIPSGKNHLIIVADGILHHLPFGALVDSSGHCLVEKYDLSYAPSAAILGLLTQRRRPCSSHGLVVAFGDPAFFGSIDSLPHSRREVIRLEALFGTPSVRTYLGCEADESNFKQQSYDDVDYLHIATHGIADERRPERSALWLAAEHEDQPPDLLQASEIAGMYIPVDLVFLSSCRSGSGLRYPGEGVLSLAQPFLVAGSNSVIVSYWNVDDRCAVELVGEFYARLHQGYAKSRALATAQRTLLRGERELFQHPYFWAPFVLTGLSD